MPALRGDDVLGLRRAGGELAMQLLPAAAKAIARIAPAAITSSGR
jgi:hypothetical protein